MPAALKEPFQESTAPGLPHGVGPRVQGAKTPRSVHREGGHPMLAVLATYHLRVALPQEHCQEGLQALAADLTVPDIHRLQGALHDQRGRQAGM